MRNELIGRLVARLGHRQAEAEGRFTDLAQRLAEGQQVDEDTALELLQAAGKTAQELAAEVQRLQRIRELERIVAEEEEVRLQLAELMAERNREIEQEEREFRELEARRNEAHGKYMDRMLLLRNKQDQIAAAKRELLALTSPAKQQEVTIEQIGPFTAGAFPVDVAEPCIASGHGRRSV